MMKTGKKRLTPDFFSSLTNDVDFFIVRHGQSEGNAGKILQGRQEYQLSELGRFQAAARGRALKLALTGAQKPLLFSSPMNRARETAFIIAEQAGLGEPVILDVLIEMSLGIWTGKSWDEVKNDDPALWADFMARSWDAIPEAESSADIYERALRAWAVMRDAAQTAGAERVVVVTHGGLIQWLLKCSFQCRSWFPLLPISNCGQFKLCVKPHPTRQSAYLGWEEIDTPIPDQRPEPQGFPA